MRTLPDKAFQLAIADPPYWSPEENTGRIRTTGNVQSSLNLGETMGEELYKELCRISEAQIIWGANNYGFPFKGFVVWDKTNIPDKFTMSKCEIASVSDNLSTVAKMFRAPSTITGLHRIHPTQKPVELYAWLLKTYAEEGWRIFDPMMGSQSSRIAAYKMGFDYVGCELDKEYFAKDCERFDRECRGITISKNGQRYQQTSMFNQY
jgi:site-specific DNA-methyltransferase (adenine-specific)